MKATRLYSKILLGIIFTSLSSYVLSQNCGMFFPLVKGTEWEMTTYNNNGKLESTNVSTITNSIVTVEGTVATVQTVSKDSKGAEQGTSSYSIKCLVNSIYIDMQTLAPSQSSAQMKGMSMKTDGTWMEIPQTLTVGQSLPDASGTMSMYKETTLFSTMKITISNRKVASKETVTTAAGTFDCFKIIQDMKIETTISAIAINIPATIMKSVDYFAAGAGMVKSESYDKNNRLNTYTELSKLTKP